MPQEGFYNLTRKSCLIQPTVATLFSYFIQSKVRHCTRYFYVVDVVDEDAEAQERWAVCLALGWQVAGPCPSRVSAVSSLPVPWGEKCCYFQMTAGIFVLVKVMIRNDRGYISWNNTHAVKNEPGVLSGSLGKLRMSWANSAQGAERRWFGGLHSWLMQSPAHGAVSLATSPSST